MALITFLPEKSDPKKKHQLTKHKHKHKQKQQQQKQKEKEKQKQPSSWNQIKNLITCKEMEGSRVHDPSKVGYYSKLGSSCSSICRDVVHGNTRVIHRADNSSPESSTLGQQTSLLTRKPLTVGSSSTRSGISSSSSSSRGIHQFRKLSGCYECHMIIDPSRVPIPRSNVCACSQCGEVFPKMESLELHQVVRHAVSELGPEDSGRNIVEIIFQSSWLRNNGPMCKIERILKVHNSQRTIERFEDCRDTVKTRALNYTRKNPRCAADGNELLRFYCTTLTCALGSRGSSALCAAVPGCGVCTVIKHGFPGGDGCKGVRTTASSGRAHESVRCGGGESRRAMLVCRVIAGRVKRVVEESPPLIEEENVSVVGSYDSVGGHTGGIYSNLEELLVFNSRAILPCFVVIYKVLPS